jgi:hypothetical protein
MNALDRELMTTVHRIEYDPARKLGRVLMAPGCCVDMSGTIALFERIDPDIRTIETFAGNETDTSYHRVNGHWRSYGADGRWW